MAGGVLGMLSPLGPVPLSAGVVLLVLGTVVAAPDAGRPGVTIERWWSIEASATLIAVAGAAFEVLVPGLGRVLVVPASVVALATAGFTVPTPGWGRSPDRD